MKKRILTVLLIVAICLSFSGCNALDEILATTYEWGNEEKTVLIARDGTEYKKIPNEQLKIIEFYNLSAGYVIDGEVPTLLAPFYGMSTNADLDHNYIGFYADGESFPKYNKGRGSDVVFCRSEIYDETVDFVENKTDAVYGYEYYDFDTGEYKFRELSNYEKSITDLVMNLGGNYEQVSKSGHNYDESVEICRYNKTGDLWVVSYGIQRIGNTYYVVVYGSKTVSLYEVPSKYADTFMIILKENTYY